MRITATKLREEPLQHSWRSAGPPALPPRDLV